MIYILYECNKTNSVRAEKQLSFIHTLLHSELDYERSRLRKEENRNLKKLFMAMCEALSDQELQEPIQRSLKKMMHNLMNYSLQYASGHHIKQGQDMHYLISIENDTMYEGEGMQIVLYHSDYDEAIVLENKGRGLQLYVNLDRLEKDDIVTRFAQGFDDLMLKEPSIQLLKRVCKLHPLFDETIPYMLMFLCHGNHMQIQVHTIKEKSSILT